MNTRNIASIVAGIIAALLTAVEIATGSNGWATAAISAAAGLGAGTFTRVVWGVLDATLG